jgi:hypothetical protein
MLPIYTITLTQTNEYDLSVTYSDSLKNMSDEDVSVALEDCIRSLQIELMLLSNKS